MKKVLKFLMIILLALLIIFPFYISISNDSIAKKVEKELKGIELPAKTELIDSISIAGKLAGNGNGMQYFGAILLKTELNEDELTKYYEQYKKDEWSCLVKKQKTEKIDVLDHGVYKFDNINKEEMEKYYIVYSWGSSENDLLDIDIRGH